MRLSDQQLMFAYRNIMDILILQSKIIDLQKIQLFADLIEKDAARSLSLKKKYWNPFTIF